MSGRGRQRARQRRAARLAARKRGGIFRAGQPQIAQQIKGPVGIFAGLEPGLDIIAGGGKAARIGLLRQIADGGAGLGEARAAIGFDQPAAILSRVDLPEPLRPTRHSRSPAADAQFRAVQQAGAAKGDGNVFQVQQRRHGPRYLRECRRPIKSENQAKIRDATGR